MSTHKITFRHVDDAMKTVIMQNRGGQQVIDRILKAYGFTSRQAFCNHLGISQSTMANRY
ncbi:TPA: bacteriophage CI repressor, partial [Escherichia coli]|nr:bacteriophage CI repressor [Escherichia coli]